MEARMTGRVLLFMGISALATAGSLSPVAAQEMPRPATLPTDLRPVQKKIDTAALVREVQASEAWIDQARTFHLTMQYTETRPPEMLEARKASYRRLERNAAINSDNFAGLLPSETYRAEIAFDETHMLSRCTSMDEGTYQTRIWDGKRLTHEYKASRTSDPSSFPPVIYTGVIFEHAMYDLSCFRLAGHPRKGTNVDAEVYTPRPDDFESLGQTAYRGVECYLLENSREHLRWFIGTKDHRVYGIITSVVTKDSQAQFDPIFRQLAIERTGKPASMDDMGALAQLTPVQQADFARELGQRTAHLARPLSEHWMTDYKEIAPGTFFPMSQGVIFFPTSPAESYSRSGSIAEVELNQPLPDDLFQ